jgi:hypothetical protein
MDFRYGALVTHGNAHICRGVELKTGFEHRTRLPFWKNRFRVSAFQGDQETVLATHPGTWLESLRDRGCMYLKYGLNSDPDNLDVVGTYEVRDNCNSVIAAYFTDRVEFYASAEQPVKPRWGVLITRVAIRPTPAQPSLPRDPDISKAALHEVLAEYQVFQMRMQGQRGTSFFDGALRALHSTAVDFEIHCGWPMTACQIMPPEVYPAVCRQVLVACRGSQMPGGSGTDQFRYADSAADNESGQLGSRVRAEQARCFPDVINNLLLTCAQPPAASRR